MHISLYILIYKAQLIEINHKIGDIQSSNYTIYQQELLNKLLDLQPEYSKQLQDRPEQQPLAGQHYEQVRQGGSSQPLQIQVVRQAFNRYSHQQYTVIHSTKRNYNRMLQVAQKEATTQKAQRFLQQAAKDSGSFYS